MAVVLYLGLFERSVQPSSASLNVLAAPASLRGASAPAAAEFAIMRCCAAVQRRLNARMSSFSAVGGPEPR